MTVSVPVMLALAGVAAIAGLVDAIAGGGGLITLPALLTAGLPPHFALGTNKGQSVFGSGAATLTFARAGALERARALVAIPVGLAGALLGAMAVRAVRPDRLRPIVLVLLIVAAVLVTLRPREVPWRLHPPGSRGAHVRAAVIGFVIAAYDGFFGPGTGTFLIVAFVMFLGDTLTRATAEAKVVNFASNLASVIVFAASGLIVWRIAIPMAIGQFVGSMIGARMAIRGGDRVIRSVVLVVVAALVVRLGWDLVHH